MHIKLNELYQQIDSIIEWLFIVISIIQATLFQFFTWGNDMQEYNTKILVLSYFILPVIIGVGVWIYALVNNNPRDGLLFRIVSIAIYSFTFVMYCLIYGLIIVLGYDPSGLSIIISMIVIDLFASAIFLRFPINRLIEMYKIAYPGHHFWVNPRNARSAIIIGYLVAAFLFLAISLLLS